MKVGTLRLAILTDFHAFGARAKPGDPKPSWLDLTENQSDPKQNPFAGLNALAQTDPLMRADIIMCLGDMGDRASAEGQQYVWREINALKTSLGASRVLATAGNHDLDSRHIYDDHDAKGQVQALSPPFPVEDERQWLEYWARNFTLLDHGGVRFALLNTAAYHGYANDAQQPEYYHGRVSERTIDRLCDTLAKEGGRAANVLICHHHPFKNDRIKSQDYSQMRGGDLLVNRLVDTRSGPWLIVHGHKHVGRVFYAPGSNAHPTVFSAASFAARPYPNQDGQHFNEFYIIELDVPSTPNSVTSLTGQVRTWTFYNGVGWQRPKAGEGLGPTAGFGARTDTGRLAGSIVSFLRDEREKQPTEWSTITERFGDVQRLVPEDFELLRDLLESQSVSLNLDSRTQEIAMVQVR